MEFQPKLQDLFRHINHRSIDHVGSVQDGLLLHQLLILTQYLLCDVQEEEHYRYPNGLGDEKHHEVDIHDHLK